ncbi:hypothetical protein ACU4GH_15365 [Bradyrhizobium betae]
MIVSFSIPRFLLISLFSAAAGAAMAGSDVPQSAPLPMDGPCVAPPAKAALTIAQVRLDAMRCNRDIIAARRGEEASQADIQIASQRPNPVLSLGVANINPHLGVGAGSPRSKTVDSNPARGPDHRDGQQGRIARGYRARQQPRRRRSAAGRDHPANQRCRAGIL